MRIALHPGTGTSIICDVIRDLRGVPVIITDREAAHYSNYDAIILLGGADINPFFYGQSKTFTKTIDRERDIIEWIMVKRAITKNLPHMGICRGHQMIAVAHGGVLYQDIYSETGVQHGASRHTLATVAPIFKRHLPSVITVLVNSLHHQAVRVVPAGFQTAATSSDGIVEAIYKPGALGVQWHPELMVTGDREWMHLFRWFVVDKLTDKV